MKAVKIVATAVFVGLVIVIGMLAWAKQPQPFPENSASQLILESGPFDVASFDETLVDSSRPTQANGSYEGADSRSLAATLWYPVDTRGAVADGEHPFVLYSHGFSSMRAGGEKIARQLASYGYVVLTVDFPLTNFSAPGGPMVKDVVNQPEDISFLMDSVLAWSEQEGHLLAGKIDPQRIGVTGISLGGMTTTLVTYHPEKRDPRVKAALSIAGPSLMFGEKFYRNSSVPFMMLATDQDALVNYEENALPVLERVAGAQLVTLAGGSHTGFSASAEYLRWFDNPDSIGCEAVLKNLDAEEEPWHEAIGSPEQGVIHDTGMDICTKLPLPSAMNPMRQHMLTDVVVLSFFQSVFAPSEDERVRYQRFLAEVMPGELAELSYQVN